MTPPEGFEVKAFASEPDITQPLAFCLDHRGRMWVAENRDYETRRSGFSADGGSRILILEDTDGDGRADSRKVFVEGIPFPAAIAWGFGGLWLGAPPNLLFIPDRNGDDKADEEDIEVRLTGWGINDRHETLNSFNWGPDGWLYGCQGLFTPSHVSRPPEGAREYTKPGKGEKFPKVEPVDPVRIDGGVWRYHPLKHRFEVVAHGFSNPWGFDFDDHGQILMTACVIPHLWHVVPGGVYHRQSGKHLNPYVYDDIKTITDHKHMSAHGGARIYLADLFPAEHRGRLFMCNIHQHAVLTDILEPKGSGFVGHHGDDFLLANDPQWLGFSVEIGPAGELLLLDWHDADICGRKVDHKETGRVYRVVPKGSKIEPPGDLSKLSDKQLVEAQLHPNDWHVRHARTILQERAAAGKLDKEVHTQLLKMLADHPETARKLRALWCLHVTGGIGQKQLLGLLTHPAPEVRGWAVQLLGEDHAAPPAALATFAEMAKSDPSPVVRLFLASALQRIDLDARWPIAEGLLSHAEDIDDHNLPKMIWFGVEPLVAHDLGRALELATSAEIPYVRQCIARRAVGGSALAKRTGGRGVTGNPEIWAKTIARVAPGFYTEAVGEGGVALMKGFRGTNAVRTHPVDRETPCVLKGDVHVPEDKSSSLRIRASHHPHGDWKLIVRAEDKVLHESVVGPETVQDEWASVEIDLSEFAGRNIRLELLNQATGWKNEWAYWDKVELISK